MEDSMTVSADGYNLQVFRDEYAESPREWDNLGKRAKTIYISEMFVTARVTNLSETVRKSVFGKLLMITTSLRQTEKAGIRVCFMSKAAPTVAIWFRSNLTRVCLIRQRKGLKTTKFITRKFIQ